VLDTCLDAAVEQLSRGSLTRSTARDVRDACMLAMCVGHVGLTVRISVVRTVKASMFAATKCSRQDCPKAHISPQSQSRCCGNRLEELPHPNAGAHEEQEEARYQLVLPHHKTSSRGISMPAISIQSAKLTTLLNVWQAHARPQVSAPSSVGRAAGSACACDSRVHRVPPSARHVQMTQDLRTRQPAWADPETLFLNDSGAPFDALTRW
jgi:hypothetical protein